MSRRVLWGVCLMVVLAITGTRLLVRAQKVDELAGQAAQVCGEVAAGRAEAAIVLSDSLSLPLRESESARQIVECRCWALRAVGQQEACTALLDARLRPAPAGQPDWDWIPPAPLVADVVRGRIADGRSEAALALARRAAAAHPLSLHLVEALLESGIARDGERAGMAFFEAHIAEREQQAPDHASRLVLGVARLRRGDAAGALSALGEVPPPEDHPQHSAWWHNRLNAQAQLGDVAGARSSVEAWRGAGAPSEELHARYAVALSMAGLRDPDLDFVPLLREALEGRRAIRDPLIVQWLHQRLIAHLMADGAYAEALDAYDAAAMESKIESVTRAEILRERAFAEAGGVDDEASRAGTLVFRLHGAPASLRGPVLHVSAPFDEPPDSGYEAHPVDAQGLVRVERRLERWPVRWVLRDGEGGVRGSGHVWPTSGGETPVSVVPTPSPEAPAAIPAAAPLPPRRTADGQRRVFAVILDCADWRLVQYLRARGEMPVLDALFANGFRAVLESKPPVTAIAMEALVWPERRSHVSVLGWAHRMGLELGGLESVGRNPLGFLEAVLPRSESLFETVGAGDRVAANMLFSHGNIDAGHHAQLVGPQGQHSDLDVAHVVRPLTADEKRALARIADDPRYRRQAESIAGELDAAVELAQGSGIDLLMLRVEALDLLTHALFSELIEGGQDDGVAGLLDVYRHLDQRLAELHAALDADDVLVVMSDHGIRTAMEHEEDAIFVAVGGGIEPGRAAGQPQLRGVSRQLAAWLDVPTSWPDGGLRDAPTTQHAERAQRAEDAPGS